MGMQIVRMVYENADSDLVTPLGVADTSLGATLGVARVLGVCLIC